MPWDESHLDIRSSHGDPSTCERDSIRTITISADQGIEAVVGKPLGRDYTVTLSFLFAKVKGWSLEKAKEWFKEHEHAAEMPPGYFPVSGSAALNPNGRVFDSMRPTVGDLVGRRLGTSQERSELIRLCPDDSACRRLHETMGLQCSGLCKVIASLNQNSAGHFDPMKPTVGSLVGVKLGASQKQCPESACARMHARTNTPCLEPRACDIIASIDQNTSAHFDPMKPTVGDLVGVKAVEVAASAPPAVRRIDGRFDPTQPTVGDLAVRGHISLGTISKERDDIVVHPRRVKECSR